MAADVPAIEAVIDDFAFLDDWEDRYRYVIELGRTLEPLSAAQKSAENKVQGCASQVWIDSHIEQRDGKPVLTFVGESDAHIVQGLIAILVSLYSGRPADEVLETDAASVFDTLGLKEHLTQQRANGLSSMVQRIRQDAASALDTAH